MSKPSRTLKYRRILLKLSGEALMGDQNFGIDPKVLDRMAVEIGQLIGVGVQVGLVVGGGNLFRGLRSMPRDSIGLPGTTWACWLR